MLEVDGSSDDIGSCMSEASEDRRSVDQLFGLGSQMLLKLGPKRGERWRQLYRSKSRCHCGSDVVVATCVADPKMYTSIRISF